MDKYIVLLRGTNVGGKNKVSMSELKKLFEQYGFKDVKTYINSGNIIFSSEITDEIKLKEICEGLISNKFKLTIPVAVICFNNLLNVLNNAPEWWDKDMDSRHNAIFIIHPLTVDEIFKEVGTTKTEYENVGHYGNVVFWSAPNQTYSKTRWSKIVGLSFYKYVTIRNANTVKNILQLAKETTSITI